ncbi:hypothetical protein MHYP_G00294750 [Metynnis hypsauchen]
MGSVEAVFMEGQGWGIVAWWIIAAQAPTNVYSWFYSSLSLKIGSPSNRGDTSRNRAALAEPMLCRDCAAR